MRWANYGLLGMVYIPSGRYLLSGIYLTPRSFNLGRTNRAEGKGHMADSVALSAEPRPGFSETPVTNEAYSSAVSWAAVIAGAFVAAALSLILLAFGTGMGLSSISPWSNAGTSASTIGKGAILWLIIVQLISSAMGGYLTGRLRTKWVSVHTDEVYFRDTAHGFLVWAVSLVITAAFLASAATSMVGGLATAGTSAGMQSAGRNLDPNEYFVDSLFRTDTPAPDRNDASVLAEVGIILVNGLRHGGLPTGDKSYLAALVAARTGLSQSDAAQRVSEVFDEARQAADTARRTAAHSLYWIFLALLIGAFCASYAATIGGKQRDRVIVV
jgi:hypothetical protein